MQHNIKQDTINKLFAEPDVLDSNWLGPSWIDSNRWQHVMHLSKTVDRLKDLPAHIERNCAEWQAFDQSPDDSLEFPPPWGECGPLEQLLVTKYLKPAALPTAMNVRRPDIAIELDALTIEASITELDQISARSEFL